ncbi:hypothetical protein NLU14_08875 [Marinobacter sp. 71-i]|uniref:Uncharacterized protein n=1 Tax=Marinobacter iranensis TaxID=2962607 RepID=A0ABT5Y9I9_9GAMM|nr:hypothetical protein [Marinobacter iranensis]MDF0750343.1 hypothetical protein [Marinobacter iranensis]
MFARTHREARALASKFSLCCDGCEYIDVRGHRLWNDEWLKKNAADQVKLAVGEPHVIDSPPSCEGCELWHETLEDSGYCSNCDPDWEASDA